MSMSNEGLSITEEAIVFSENERPKVYGRTVLELLAEPDTQPQMGRPGDPPPTPPQPFPTAPQVTPYDLYGNPDFEADEEYLYE
jgi:hypothetical protein